MRWLRRDSNWTDRRQRVFYASDIHGCEGLWRKFLAAACVYEADVLIMGGDVTGKAVIPLVEHPQGYAVRLFGRSEVVAMEVAEETEHRIRANGMYPLRMSPEQAEETAGMSAAEKQEWFAEVMKRSFDRWLALADERLAGSVRCFVMPGNDDLGVVEQAIRTASKVEECDERVVQFDGYEMISLGHSNPTPFRSPRELDEEELYRRICDLADKVEDISRCIFNLHVPPYDSSLDTAPELTAGLEIVMSGPTPKTIAVGSTAVRKAIERYQPMLSLHGHIHESPGATQIGRTLCINPGSEYPTGRISGCLLQLAADKVQYQFVKG